MLVRTQAGSDAQAVAETRAEAEAQASAACPAPAESPAPAVPSVAGARVALLAAPSARALRAVASCTPAIRFFGSFFARRRRSFSSASERRVYTGSAKAGACRRASKGSAAPARHAACSASSSPRPVGAHSPSGSSVPHGANSSAYLPNASPAISSNRPCGAQLLRQPPRPGATRSASRRPMPASDTANRTGYTSLRMASATTSTGPRTPACHAPHATASSDDTPTKCTPSADAMPLAVASAMRTPVNDPGPRPHTTHAISLFSTPCAARAASMRGSSCVLDARRASTSKDSTTSTVGASSPGMPSPAIVPGPRRSPRWPCRTRARKAPRRHAGLPRPQGTMGRCLS